MLLDSWNQHEESKVSDDFALAHVRHSHSDTAQKHEDQLIPIEDKVTGFTPDEFGPRKKMKIWLPQPVVHFILCIFFLFPRMVGLFYKTTTLPFFSSAVFARRDSQNRLQRNRWQARGRVWPALCSKSDYRCREGEKRMRKTFTIIPTHSKNENGHYPSWPKSRFILSFLSDQYEWKSRTVLGQMLTRSTRESRQRYVWGQNRLIHCKDSGNSTSILYGCRVQLLRRFFMYPKWIFSRRKSREGYICVTT